MEDGQTITFILRTFARIAILSVHLTLSLSYLNCSARHTPRSEDLTIVEERLSYLKNLPQVAWIDRHPPATIVIGWKQPASGFAAQNHSAATKAAEVAAGIRIISVKDFQRTMWQQVIPICESNTRSGTPAFESNCR